MESFDLHQDREELETKMKCQCQGKREIGSKLVWTVHWVSVAPSLRPIAGTAANIYQSTPDVHIQPQH